MSTLWLMLGALGSLLAVWLWLKTKRPYLKYNIPPFPSKPLPIVGHFFLIFTNLRDAMKVWRQKAGDIYSLDLAGELNILVNDFNDIKEIWVKNADRIVNTQHSLGDEILNEVNVGIIPARDDNWKEQRTTSISILRSLGMGKNLMAEKILEEVEVLVEKISSFNGQAKDVKLLLNASVSNVISTVAVGKRFEYDDPQFITLIAQLNAFVKYFSNVILLTPFKQLLAVPGDFLHVKEWTKAAAAITEDYSKPYINEIKKSYKDFDEPQNFAAAYIKEMNDRRNKKMNSNLDERNLVSIIRTLFSAGTDTTSTTILWCLLYMLHNPRVQEKVYKEIEAVVGSERIPNLSDKTKLPYLNAVIMETQRMASLAPIGIRREVSETFEACGYTIPKGTILWPILDSVLHEKKIWGDPENFRPERFIDGNGALINREELIPFSIGRRVCMGEALAKMELFLYLAVLFQRFRFEPADKSGNLPTLKEVFGATLVPHPFKMKFIDRKK